MTGIKKGTIQKVTTVTAREKNKGKAMLLRVESGAA